MKSLFFLLLISAMADEHTRVGSRGSLNETGSQMIDRLIGLEWKKKTLTPAPRIQDWEFLRRSTLDFAGRLPLPAEYDRFFAMPEDKRRSQWCDFVTTHPDTQGYWARFWEESLIDGAREATSSQLQTIIGSGMSDWKRLATRLLEGQDSQTYLSRLQGEPIPVAKRFAEGPFDMVPAALSSSKVLLGTSLQCAQCHDHMFEPYKQEEFWGLTALFRKAGGKTPLEVTYKDNDQNEYKAKPSFFGKPLDGSLSHSITQSPNFARAIVNQVWGQIFGIGFNAPGLPSTVNDPSKTINVPVLLDALAERFRTENHNQDKLMTWICKSDLYSIGSEETNDDAKLHHFAALKIKAMNRPQFTRTMAGLRRASKGKTGDLNRQDLENFLSAEVIQGEMALSPNALLYLWNNPEFRKFLAGYWETALKTPMTKEQAIQSASRLLMGKELPADILAQYMEVYRDLELNPEFMAEISSQFMSSSFFLYNR